MFDRVIYGDERVYINGYELSGVQSVNGGFTKPIEDLRMIGSNSNPSIFQGNIEGNINISRLIISDDPIKHLTGEFPATGFISYGNSAKTFGFHTGYLNNYTINASVGGIPTVDTSFTVYGSIGGSVTGVLLSGVHDYPIKISRPGDIQLTLDEATTNRVTSFTYSVPVTRTPYYAMGSLIPFEITTEYPIIINLDLNIEIDPSYTPNELFTILCQPVVQNITIDFNTCDDSIMSLSLQNAELVSENIDFSVNNHATTTIKYRSKIEKG